VAHSVALLFAMTMTVFTAVAAETNAPQLQFVAPTNHALFTTRDEVPVLLRGSAPNDVFLNATVLANQLSVGTATFCCPFCPCAHPLMGDETTLQIPVPWKGGMPPSRTWQGWTNVQAGAYRLTARATGEVGTVVEALPVNITVVDTTLLLFARTDGSVWLTIPGGSLVPGGYDAEASTDLRTWTRLGAFQPGNVAAFYSDPPDPTRRRRFYRAVYLPPRVP